MKKIETLKNIALIVLFFTTMLFLYSFWGNPIDKSFRLADLISREEVDIPSFESVTVPRLVVLNSGEGTFSIVEENQGNKWRLILVEMTDEGNSIESVDEINKTQYDLIMEYRSLALNFSYGLPVEALTKKYGVSDNQTLDQIGEINIIAYSAASRESLFVYNESKDKYYRIVYKNDLKTLDRELEEIAFRTNYNYYKIGQAIGTDNETIVPVSGVFSSEDLVYVQEFQEAEEEEKKEFAKIFFGESLDFVRKIQGSKGSLTFMYGYGEKILTINSSGKIEYRNNESPQGLQQSYVEALEKAMEYIAYHGGWDFGKAVEMRPYVSQVEAIEIDRQKGYRIVFGLDLGKDALYLKEGDSLAVDIINGVVVRYQRDIIMVEEDHYYQSKYTNEKEIYPVVNALASNYVKVGESLKSLDLDFGEIKGEDVFIAISHAISHARSGYLQDTKDEDQDGLKPVWAVQVNEDYIYFDLFTGEFLGVKD